MIASVNDYRFVTGENIDEEHPHGDMDRIIIDGNIMPLRTGTTSEGIDRKKILRGEDICFLAEGAMERRLLYGSYSGSTDVPFSRNINAGAGIGTRNATPKWISEILQNYSNPQLDEYVGVLRGWVKTFPADGTYDVENKDVFGLYERSDLSSKPSDYASGVLLGGANIAKLFDDERNLSVGIKKCGDFYHTGAILGDKITGKKIYRSDYPIPSYEYSSPSIVWFGGSELPESRHEYGGLIYTSFSYFIYLDLDESIPLDYPLGQGDVWINFYMNYSGGPGTSRTIRLIKNLGHWNRSNENRLWIKVSSSTIRSILIDVWQNKLGLFDISGNLPDEFGWKDLEILDQEGESSVSDRSVAWMTIPIDRTRW